ncbi:glycosyltransferase family 4 protein, partial [Akkermansiaceae bacterium]|nr:glycosyltransferase family 4 protein [Akkermansiaceae bacterium]
VDDYSIFHSSYFRFSRNKSVKNITTVYDFTYELHIKGLSAKFHKMQKGLAIKNASGIICISESTKKDLLSFYPDLDSETIRVIYLAASDCYYKINNLDILETRFASLKGKKILSFVGKRIKYKNFSLAVNMLKNLPKEYHLVIIGGGDLNNDEIDLLSFIEKRFTHFKNVNSEELNIVYNISFCYLYLSEYEGFGIPVLEAMQAGCPVLAQNISSIPEVYGKVDNLVMNINSVSECCEKILRLEEVTYRKKVIDQGIRNAENFSWDKTFNQTFDFYNYVNDL